MKIFHDYNDLPPSAAYIGGTCPDGSMDESTADTIGDALDLAMETTKC